MSTIDPGMESLMEAFIYETTTLLEQLDEIMLESEKERNISGDNINEIFRIMHTIKGSAAMMGFTGISNMAHSVEDVFYIIRENPSYLDMVCDAVFDLVFQASDFLKQEIENVQGEDYQENDPTPIIQRLEQQAAIMKGEEAAPKEQVDASADSISDVPQIEGGNVHYIRVKFEDGCQMENIRAFALVNQVKDLCEELKTVPENPEKDASLCEEIVQNGFLLIVKPHNSIDEIEKVVETALNVQSYEIEQPPALEQPKSEAVEQPVMEEQPPVSIAKQEAEKPKSQPQPAAAPKVNAKQSLISVNQSKLDHLMDLVGELVTAESIVASNPDLKGQRLDNFTKSIRELRKLTDELQDVVMSIRMVPLNGTFQKMNRIVRDMCKKLGKRVDLVTEGGETEVDKTINDAIADPFMHMIRNSMDHGIESVEERIASGKSEVGQIKLSARNAGGEILIDIADDGQGLDTHKLLQKARNNGLLVKAESDYTDKEIFHLIMLPGFSTNEQVTEFSGRGVGMDVVRKNVEKVGGSISIDSTKGKGTTFTIKIPLTLAIMDGMDISVGDTTFTIPITSIKQSFKITDGSQVFFNTDGKEMIMLRGECYPIVRLHELFQIPTEITDLQSGIMIQVESSNNIFCIFADELIGEQQVVVKPFPPFFNKYGLKDSGLSGCTILGDGNISLIIDVRNLVSDR